MRSAPSHNNEAPDWLASIVDSNAFFARNFGVLFTNNFATPSDLSPVLAAATALSLRCNRIVGSAPGGLLDATPLRLRTGGTATRIRTRPTAALTAALSSNLWLVPHVTAPPLPGRARWIDAGHREPRS